MQNFCSIHELDGAGTSRETQPLRKPGHGEVRSKSQWEAHHAL
jgi:hypothetical protein